MIATGIVNMWATPTVEVAASYHRLNEAHGGRFLLGVGVGHPEATQEYRSPYETIVRYLDDLDAASVPVEGRCWRRSARRCCGWRRSARRARTRTSPRPSTPVRRARRWAQARCSSPSRRSCSTPTPGAPRAGAESAGYHLRLRNYVNNFKRLGFTDEDVADDGSDALLDALIAQGDAAALAARVTGHLDAGADQVAVQVLGEDDLSPRPARDLRGARLERVRTRPEPGASLTRTGLPGGVVADLVRHDALLGLGGARLASSLPLTVSVLCANFWVTAAVASIIWSKPLRFTLS